MSSLAVRLGISTPGVNTSVCRGQELVMARVYLLLVSGIDYRDAVNKSLFPNE